jgi:hypothetical protein
MPAISSMKVISEKYVGDESARLRFLREARAAAKVRHGTVASVLHLGRTDNGYFYAMEFVEGETLGNLIQRCGHLDVKRNAGNCGAGCSRFRRSAQAEPDSSGHQAQQHHGEPGRGRRRNREDHRPWAGEDRG